MRHQSVEIELGSNLFHRLIVPSIMIYHFPRRHFRIYQFIPIIFLFLVRATKESSWCLRHLVFLKRVLKNGDSSHCFVIFEC
jgi:hypothetical protein